MAPLTKTITLIRKHDEELKAKIAKLTMEIPIDQDPIGSIKQAYTSGDQRLNGLLASPFANYNPKPNPKDKTVIYIPHKQFYTEHVRTAKAHSAGLRKDLKELQNKVDELLQSSEQDRQSVWLLQERVRHLEQERQQERQFMAEYDVWADFAKAFERKAQNDPRFAPALSALNDYRMSLPSALQDAALRDVTYAIALAVVHQHRPHCDKTSCKILDKFNQDEWDDVTLRATEVFERAPTTLLNTLVQAWVDLQEGWASPVLGVLILCTFVHRWRTSRIRHRIAHIRLTKQDAKSHLDRVYMANTARSFAINIIQSSNLFR